MRGREKARPLGQIAPACWTGPVPPRKQVGCSAESRDQDSLSAQLLPLKAEARGSFPLPSTCNFHSSPCFLQAGHYLLTRHFFFFSAHLSFLVLAHQFVLYSTSPSLLPPIPLSRTGWGPPAWGSGDFGLWQGCGTPGGDPTLSLGLLASTGQAPWLESRDV